MAARLPPRVPSFAMTGAVGVQPLVLLVNEEPSTQRLLVSALASHGFRCLRAVTKTDALIRALKLEPDLVLLDSGPKGVDAVGITARLREWTSAPILVLLPRSQSRERTALLDAGASDYVVKTVGTSDLVARMRVWLRQQRRRGRQEPGAERLRIDHERRLLLVDGREIHLTPIECKVLLALARRPGAWMKEAQILAAVWGKGSRTSARHLHAHVRRLRDKMERDPARPDHLVTETHGGYRLKLG